MKHFEEQISRKNDTIVIVSSMVNTITVSIQYIYSNTPPKFLRMSISSFIGEPEVPSAVLPGAKNEQTSTEPDNKGQPEKQESSKSQSNIGQQTPVFWHLLSEADKKGYNTIRSALASPACKHRRHHSTELNREIIKAIKNFVVRNDADDWKRALVTGIVWLPNAIAINTRQLRILLSKCKSSINALFQNLGYCTIPTTNDYSSSIISYFPLLKDNFTELRKWTIRLAVNPGGQANLPTEKQMNLNPIPEEDQVNNQPGNDSVNNIQNQEQISNLENAYSLNAPVQTDVKSENIPAESKAPE